MSTVDRQANPSLLVAKENQAVKEGRCTACGNDRPSVWLQAPDRYHGRDELYTLVRCSSCGLVWIANPPLPEDMGRHYGPDYDRSVAAAGSEPNRWRSRWEELARQKGGGAILDLGCSSGGFLTGLKNSTWDLYGVEMSDAVASRAVAACGAKVFVGDILDAPFAEQSFDAITCFHVFEHLYHPREVLQKVAGWLRPGGIFYTVMPNIASAGSRIFGSYWYALELPRHLFHFSPKSLQKLAGAVGFESVSIKTHREVFIESSTRYLMDEAFRTLGIGRTPLAQARQPGIPFRIGRKAFRLSLLPALNRAAALAGDGESIHAIFHKGGRAS